MRLVANSESVLGSFRDIIAEQNKDKIVTLEQLCVSINQAIQ